MITNLAEVVVEAKRLDGLADMRQSEKTLRTIAKTEGIAIPKGADKYAVSGAIRDAVDGRLGTLVQDAAKSWGCSFDAAQEAINAAW